MLSSSRRSSKMGSRNGYLNLNAMTAMHNGVTAPMVSVSAGALRGNKKSTFSIEQRRQSHNANIKLINEVRRRPFLYDSNHEKYGKKHFMEKNWNQIGKICNDSAVNCKHRWRNIRAAFARSIDIYKTHSGPNRVKKYYLHEHLKFLIDPMTKRRKSNSNFEDSSTENTTYKEEQSDDQNFGENDESLQVDDSECEEPNIPPDDNDELNDNPIHNGIPTNELSGDMETIVGREINSTITENNISNNGLDDTMNGSNHAFETPKRPHTGINNTNTPKESTKRIKRDLFDHMDNERDLHFVKSLYYEMQDLTPAQKLHLKKCIYVWLHQVVSTPMSSRQPGSAAEKLCFHISKLNEPQLQQLNRYIKTVLSPSTLNAGSSSSHLMLNGGNTNIRDNGGSSELSNCTPPHPIIVKEESSD